MNESQIAVRYAKALFSLAEEQSRLTIIRNDIEILYQFCQVEEFVFMLEHPTIKSSEKKQILLQIFEVRLTKTSLDFLNVLIQNKRENYLKDIVRNFLDLYRKQTGIKKATLTTAETIDSNLSSRIKYWIKTEFKTQIDLEENIDEKLIGGFVLRIDDLQIDASVRYQLKKIKQNLLV